MDLRRNEGAFNFVVKRISHLRYSAMASDIEAVIQFSLEKLGYSELKAEQERVVKEFLSGKDVFGALPTGYGKSLCYAVLLYAKFEGRAVCEPVLV